MTTLAKIKEELLDMGKNGEKVFGTYPVHPLKQDADVIKFIERLQELNIEADEDIFGEFDFEDYVFDKMPSPLADEIEEDFDRSGNSYNWNAPIVFQYRPFKLYDGIERVAIAFHKYGDVRANYTRYAVLKCYLEKFWEILAESTIDIPCEDNDWSISQYLHNENGYISAYHYPTGDSFDGYYTDEDCPEVVSKAVENWM